MNRDEQERRRRWRLILGEAAAGLAEADSGPLLTGPHDQGIDRALGDLYDASPEGGLGQSAPRLLRWLGDIRHYFPAEVVTIIQRDALARLDLESLPQLPDLLEAVEPDVALIPVLLALAAEMPATTRDAAREVVRRLVARLTERLRQPIRQAVRGHLERIRPPRPRRWREIDWPRTIRANLANSVPGHPPLLNGRLIGRRGATARPARRTIIICLDQSGSMARSAVHAAIMAAVIAAIPTFRTHLIAFDTSVVDLTPFLDDPVELLFNLNLGGGTDMRRALDYARQLMVEPSQTLIFLISDLFDAGDRDALLATLTAIDQSGARLVPLLALDNDGAPAFNHDFAAWFANHGRRPFAATPDQFPELLRDALDS
jgi:uncharacterized protein with von Willebrand factor type A (vWA) domain